jgi:hypothetical protein
MDFNEDVWQVKSKHELKIFGELQFLVIGHDTLVKKVLNS